MAAGGIERKIMQALIWRDAQDKYEFHIGYPAGTKAILVTTIESCHIDDVFGQETHEWVEANVGTTPVPITLTLTPGKE